MLTYNKNKESIKLLDSYIFNYSLYITKYSRIYYNKFEETQIYKRY